MDTFKDTSTIKEQFNKFIVDNNLIGTTAGVGIGLATKDVIQSFVSDIIFPVFYLIVYKLKLPYFKHNKHPVDYIIFFKQFITWLVIIIVTFLFVQLSFKILLGVDNSKKDDKKK
jgi:large-conductance mechanosensitive channel